MELTNEEAKLAAEIMADILRIEFLNEAEEDEYFNANVKEYYVQINDLSFKDYASFQVKCVFKLIGGGELVLYYYFDNLPF